MVPASHIYNVRVVDPVMLGQSIASTFGEGGELMAKGTGMRKEKKKPKKKK